jgi:hypothetical protein
MSHESSITGFDRAFKGRNLIKLAVIDVVLFLIANIAYGAGNQHGLRNSVSNVTWALFLIGFFLLIVSGIICLARVMLRRRARAHA